MNSKISFIFIYLFVFFPVIFPTTYVHAQPAEKVLEWRGENRGLGEPTAMLIKDKEVWQSVYGIIFRKGVDSRKITEIPDIDFSRYMVVAVFLGYRGDRGERANITKAEEMHPSDLKQGRFANQGNSITNLKDKCFVIEYEVLHLAAGHLMTAISWPFHMKVVNKSDLPVVIVKREREVDIKAWSEIGSVNRR